VVSDLSLRKSLEVKIERLGYDFGVKFHPAESLVNNKPVTAIGASVPLNLPELGFSDTALYNILALAGRAQDLWLCAFDVPRCTFFLYIPTDFKRELDGMDVLAWHVMSCKIGTGARPCIMIRL